MILHANVKLRTELAPNGSYGCMYFETKLIIFIHTPYDHEQGITFTYISEEDNNIFEGPRKCLEAFMNDSPQSQYPVHMESNYFPEFGFKDLKYENITWNLVAGFNNEMRAVWEQVLAEKMRRGEMWTPVKAIEGPPKRIEA